MRDELKLFMLSSRGVDYRLNENISIRHPTLGEICEFGEMAYYSMASCLCGYPSLYKSSLHDIGIDYTQVTDYEFFCMVSQGMEAETTSILLGGLDLSKLKLGKNDETDEIVLCDSVDGMPRTLIDRAIYMDLVGYLRDMHGFEKKEEIPADEYTKNYLIERERKRLARHRKKPVRSILKPLISAMVNQPGFKYDYTTVWDLPIHVFNESVSRTQKFHHYSNLMTGVYTGNVNPKEVKKEDLNWLG